MLADLADAVVGADTHRDTHTLQIAHPSGAPIAECTVSNDDDGYAQAIAWALRHAPGPRLYFAVEGTRSYGIGLARALTAAGWPVLEIAPPARGARRGKGKNDTIDAGLAVVAALRSDVDRLPTPRSDGDREALRILLGARQEMSTTRTRQVNRLRALLLAGDETDRQQARSALTRERLRALAAPTAHISHNRHDNVRQAEIQRLAAAVALADINLAANQRELTALVTDMAPNLLTRRGIGPISAAQAIVSYSHTSRCRNEAAYASLAGASPIPASSGQTIRWRLNRGGDRALNRALHTIAHSRMTSCPKTHDYIAKRRAEGKTTAEIRRCLKRYIARELFKALNKSLNG
jgi:transposase